MARDSAATVDDFAVAEVMEFKNNFYAVVEEPSTGRGAFELLIDPYTGAVAPEPGPNMMWNDKYGHMSFGAGGENRLSMDEAGPIRPAGAGRRSSPVARSMKTGRRSTATTRSTSTAPMERSPGC